VRPEEDGERLGDGDHVHLAAPYIDLQIQIDRGCSRVYQDEGEVSRDSSLHAGQCCGPLFEQQTSEDPMVSAESRPLRRYCRE